MRIAQQFVGHFAPDKLEKAAREVPRMLLEDRPGSLADSSETMKRIEAWYESAKSERETGSSENREELSRCTQTILYLNYLVSRRLRVAPAPLGEGADGFVDWFAGYELARKSPWRCSLPIAVDWGQDKDATIATLELVLISEVVKNAAQLHPAYKFAYRRSTEFLEGLMAQAMEAGRLVVNAHTYGGYWTLMFRNAPLEGPDGEVPRGDSATGAAFYGWGKLLRAAKKSGRWGKLLRAAKKPGPRPDRSVLSRTFVMARVELSPTPRDATSADLRPFTETSGEEGEEVLRRKAQAIARHVGNDGATIVVAGEHDAKVIYEAIRKAEAHERIKVRYPR